MNDARALGHLYPEAFCLMKYQTDDGSEVEWIWNSRDGVTPFCITSRHGKLMSHVQWQFDCYLPLNIPLPGERIFVDLTREIALPGAEAFVERTWDSSDYPMRESFPNREAAIEFMVDRWTAQPGSPAVVDVKKEP